MSKNTPDALAKQAAKLEELTRPISQEATRQARKHGSTQKIDFNKALNQWDDDDDYLDPIIAPPQPTAAMFYGLTGEIARIAAHGTEVNPVSAAMVFLSFFGAYVGRDTFLHINNTVHHPRLFTLHIGRSGSGKGDAQQLVLRVMRRINEIDK